MADEKFLDSPKPSVEAVEQNNQDMALPPDQAFSFEEKTEAEKKLVRKIDLFIMPTIWVVYFLSYMVRATSLQVASIPLLTEHLGPFEYRKRKSSWNGRCLGSQRQHLLSCSCPFPSRICRRRGSLQHDPLAFEAIPLHPGSYDFLGSGVCFCCCGQDLAATGRSSVCPRNCRGWFRGKSLSA